MAPPHYEVGKTMDAREVAAAVGRLLFDLDVAQTGADVALARDWSGLPSHDRSLAFVCGVWDSLADRTGPPTRSTSCSKGTWL